MRRDMGVPDGGRTWTVEEREALMDEAMAELAEAGFFPPGSPDVPLLAEMIVCGDGGLILERVRLLRPHMIPIPPREEDSSNWTRTTSIKYW